MTESATTNSVLEGVLSDLATLSDELEGHVAELDDRGWRTPTPAPGWDVATQIAHLAWTDEAALASATDKQRWDELVLEAMADPEHAVDTAALTGAGVAPAALLARWRSGRSALAEALRGVPAGEKLPWYGPPMSPTSMATARFMETWAHGRDVYDALGVDVVPTDTIFHVAHIGTRTRDFAYHVRGQQPPSEQFRIELTAPSGARWTWGPEDAPQRVIGSAYDFCLLVTQRVHRADTDLVAVGDDAEQWLGIAQCFAGSSGEGRQARG